MVATAFTSCSPRFWGIRDMVPARSKIKAIDDWNTLREAAVLGYGDAVLSLAMIEMLERSNRPNCVIAINEAEAGYAATLVKDALLFRLHIFVTRAFAHVRHPDDRHLRAAIEFLEQNVPFPPGNGPEQPHRLLHALAKFNEVANGAPLGRLKKMRDKQLAHLATYTDVDRPTFDDLFNMARLTSEIWENLSIGSATIFVEVSHQVEAYRRSADRFWTKFDDERITSDQDDEPEFQELLSDQ